MLRDAGSYNVQSNANMTQLSNGQSTENLRLSNLEPNESPLMHDRLAKETAHPETQIEFASIQGNAKWLERVFWANKISTRHQSFPFNDRFYSTTYTAREVLLMLA